jgi:hypothetical protein
MVVRCPSLTPRFTGDSASIQLMQCHGIVPACRIPKMQPIEGWMLDVDASDERLKHLQDSIVGYTALCRVISYSVSIQLQPNMHGYRTQALESMNKIGH